MASIFAYNSKREVICGDAVEWLEKSNESLEGSVFTAVPDVKDVPYFNSMSDVRKRGELYTQWFCSIAEAIFRRLAVGQVAIFSQTDAKVIDVDGHVVAWIDKSHLCSVAAEKHGCTLLWHKIALNTDHEEGDYRPSFTHLICFGKQFTYHTALFPTPDVLDRGLMTWQKATGLDSCILGVAFLRNVVKAQVVLSPFCGRGTILAVANYFGLPSFGIEIAPKRARTSGAKNLSSVLDSVPEAHLQRLGMLMKPTIGANIESTDACAEQQPATQQLNCEIEEGNDGEHCCDEDFVEFSFGNINY